MRKNTLEISFTNLWSGDVKARFHADSVDTLGDNGWFVNDGGDIEFYFYDGSWRLRGDINLDSYRLNIRPVLVSSDIVTDQRVLIAKENGYHGL